MAKKKSKKENKPTEENGQTKEGFITEISEKITEAKSIKDLEALNDRVFDIWADNVPAEIAKLAEEKGEELIENEKPKKDVAEAKIGEKKGWEKCSGKELKQAEEDGTLVGYKQLDKDTFYAKISK